ncbi:MAG: hypothetical protein K2O05_01065 [Anaeroplasmataceae bacterium]|nr:hypothetical protein [Anaeroplasmataceae bacterium]MDE7100427.1 hypothetical protein [Anaeroplasmataceae bacterium]
MLELIKKNYLNILIAALYTLLADLVYGIWTYTAWRLWYVTFIIVLVITGIGLTISYFWLRSEIKTETKEVQEVKEENIKE